METQRERLAAAIDIFSWLADDAAKPEEERVARDRQIGKELGSGLRRHERVLAWWQRLEKGASRGRRIAAMVGVIEGLLVLGGVVTGVAVAGAAFAYQGNQPVNLFALLGILVGLPLIMLMFQLLFIRGRPPLPASITDALAVLSPARWAGSWLEHRLQTGLFDTVGTRSSRTGFARWQLLAFSQSFAIGFFSGVLLLAGLLVIFTDLAFGWSTTLQLDAVTVWRVLHAIALPWAPVLPTAVPDPALVEASRFFRIERLAMETGSAAELGRWWPFVLMTILVYGLLPRLLFAIVANWKVRKATVLLLSSGPEIAALLDRLAAPRVAFEAPPREEGREIAGEVEGMPSLTLDDHSVVVVWNEAIGEEQLRGWLARHGGARPVVIECAEWDTAATRNEALAKIDATPDRVVILTKGWEPPLLSFNDFISFLREQIGSDPVIVVAPLGAGQVPIGDQERSVWSRALAASGDHALYVTGAGV